MKKKDSFFVPLIITLSVIVPIKQPLMIFPDYLHIKSNNIDFSSLPFFHILNGCTGILLFTGYVLIKNKNTKAHTNFQ